MFKCFVCFSSKTKSGAINFMVDMNVGKLRFNSFRCKLSNSIIIIWQTAQYQSEISTFLAQKPNTKWIANGTQLSGIWRLNRVLKEEKTTNTMPFYFENIPVTENKNRTVKLVEMTMVSVSVWNECGSFIASVLLFQQTVWACWCVFFWQKIANAQESEKYIFKMNKNQ